MIILRDAGFLLLGLATGLMHFQLLRWNTRLFVATGTLWAVVVQLLRLTATVAILVFAVWHGALSLLLTALGVMIARQIAVRRAQVLP